MGWRRFTGGAVLGLGLLALAACDTAPVPTTSPKVRPPGLNKAPRAVSPAQPSARSVSLARYYAQVQQDLLAQGLLRTGGGGVDTPYTDTDLARNFERIAFYDEYAQGGGFRQGSGHAGGLRKWTTPVRIDVEFGASVPNAQRASDTAMVNSYAARLARVTGHSISVNDASPNFHVLIMGEDDREQAVARVHEIVPQINSASLNLFRNLPRSIHCFVVAFSTEDNDYSYHTAIALIRAEHPDLLRRSCIHEELAQGLGLANDSPRARPSIFNDDDEFALLTTHDEELLRLLYNPALTPGMGPDQARPIVARLLAGRSGPI